MRVKPSNAISMDIQYPRLQTCVNEWCKFASFVSWYVVFLACTKLNRKFIIKSFRVCNLVHKPNVKCSQSALSAYFRILKKTYRLWVCMFECWKQPTRYLLVRSKRYLEGRWIARHMYTMILVSFQITLLLQTIDLYFVRTHLWVQQVS